MLDEAFLPFEEIVDRMLAFRGELVNEEEGVRSYITRYEIESPLELDVVRDEQGGLHIGSVPPLYHVDTSLKPAFHHLRFVAELDRSSDGD